MVRGELWEECQKHTRALRLGQGGVDRRRQTFQTDVLTLRLTSLRSRLVDHAQTLEHIFQGKLERPWPSRAEEAASSADRLVETGVRY